MRNGFRRQGLLPCRLLKGKQRQTRLTDDERKDLQELKISLCTLLENASQIPSTISMPIPLGAQLEASPTESQALLLPFATVIPADDLNLHTLNKYANLSLEWTDDICEHLLVSGNSVRIFDRPTVINLPRPEGTNLPFMYEVKLTYPNLFRAYGARGHQGILSRIILRKHWCPCKTCQLYSLAEQARHDIEDHFDPLVKDMIHDPDNKYRVVHWNQDRFSSLWPRIEQLNKEVRDGKPRNFQVLFSDRRDAKDFWTMWYVSFTNYTLSSKKEIGSSSSVWYLRYAL